MHKAILPVLFGVIAMFFIGLFTGYHIAEKNNEEYYSKVRHNFEQREAGYRLRLDALAKAGRAEGLRADSILSCHRDLIRQNSLLRIELKSVNGKFNKLTSTELGVKMVDEYNKSK